MMSGSAFSWVTQILVSLTSPDSEVPMTKKQSSWVVSLIELGNLVTPIPAGLLVDSLGRKPCLLATAPLYILSWLLVLTTRSVRLLYIVRFIQGIGMGVVFVVLPSYLGEIAEPRHRGTLSTLFEVMWYLGVLLQYCVAPLVSYQVLGFLSLSVPIAYMVGFILMPETPYFLLLVGKDQEALDTLLWLRGVEHPNRQVEAELKSMKFSVEEDLAQKTSNSWSDLVSTPANRRCLLIVLAVSLLEIVSGIPAILSYVTEALTNTKGSSFLKADQYTVLIGVSILISTVVSAATVDHLGRRPILLTSCLGAAICQMISGAYFFIDSQTQIDVSGYSWVAFLSISCYGILLCGGIGAVSTTIQSEFFPSHTRGLGNGVNTMTINVVSFLCLKLYQDVESSVGLFLNFWLYAVCGFLGSVFIYFYIPETKGKTFAEIHHDMAKLNAKPESPEDKIVKKV
ncbi:hypothetical protein J6590_021369 [Homalodisca vitripennis]|nr:hypothetical protein J6590_021369 [Homalodisca vitripennis]